MENRGIILRHNSRERGREMDGRLIGEGSLNVSLCSLSCCDAVGWWQARVRVHINSQPPRQTVLRMSQRAKGLGGRERGER